MDSCGSGATPCIPMSASLSSLTPTVANYRTRLWPAVLATLLTSAGFAGLKFVLIGEIALDFDPQTHQPLPFAWMEAVLQRCLAKNALTEAVAQGLAAVLTFGVLLGFLLNSPLAGAWRCGRLFVLACAGMAVGTLATQVTNKWLVMVFVGICYGAACAARGKAIPLLARATGRGNTFVSGLINAAMVIGLLGGTVLGMVLHGSVTMPWWRHGLLAAFLVVATILATRVRPPEPRPMPFKQGLRELLAGTWRMTRAHWPLLVGGGLAWGIASAASLAVFVDGLDRLTINGKLIPPALASTLVVFPAVGAIIGNLTSHWFSRRRHVIAAYLLMAVVIGIYPHVVDGYWGAALAMIVVGALFACPTNVLDAKLMACAAKEGLAGRGSTVMSLVHNVFILVVGSTLALALFLGWMTAFQQFSCLAAIAVLTALVSVFARLSWPGHPEVSGARPVLQS